MTDKVKDQESAAPAATEKKQSISLKTRKNASVIINPPEKVDPQRGFQERFKVALAKHTVMIEDKTSIVLHSKASTAGFPANVIEQVYIRGYKSLPLNSDLTREQYAMNRVNSFVAGGAAMVEDCDVLPIYERVGMKGTGGAMRPHIKREKNVYNGKIVFHVVDKAGHVKHTTSDEFEAKKHLAAKYRTYSESKMHPKPQGDKGEYKPMLAKLTPQRGKGTFEVKIKEETLSELSNDLLDRYKKKAGEAASAADKKGDYATGNKRFKGIIKATNKQFDNDMKKEETQLQELSKDKLNSYLWSAKNNRDQMDAKASKAMEKNRKQFSLKRHANVTKLLDKSLKRTGSIIKATDKIMAKKD